MLARSEPGLGEAVAEIEAAGGTAIAVVTDVQDDDKLSGAVERVQAELGPAVVLVNNAAVVAPLGPLCSSGFVINPPIRSAPHCMTA